MILNTKLMAEEIKPMDFNVASEKPDSPLTKSQELQSAYDKGDRPETNENLQYAMDRGWKPETTTLYNPNGQSITVDKSSPLYGKYTSEGWTTTQPKADNPTTSTTPTTPTDTTPTTTTDTPKLSDTAQAAANAVQSAADMAEQQMASLTSQFEKYREGLDANMNSTIDSIERTFAARKEQMNQINQSTLGGLAIAGNRAGRQRYATEIQTSILSAEERAGVARLNELDIQEQQLIQQAKFAALSGEWEAFNNYQSRLTELHSNKVNALLDLNTLMKQEEDRIYQKQQQALLDEQQETQFLYQEATNKVNSYLSVGFDMSEIPKQQIAEIEEGLQLPTGTFERYYEGIKSINIEEQLAGNIDTTKKIMDILAMVPNNSTIEINGIEYPGMKEVSTMGMDTTMMTTDYKNWLLTGQDTAFGDYMRTKKLEENGLPTNVNSQIDSLSKSFESSPIVQNFVDVQNKKRSVDAIIEMGVGGPGDLALVFEFMKALDPTSVVRESEYESAAKSGNIFLGTMAKFNGYLKAEGGFLPDSVKNSFKAITNEKYNIVAQQYDNYYNETARKINMKLAPYNMSDGEDYLVNFKFADPNDPFGDVNWGDLDSYISSGF